MNMNSGYVGWSMSRRAAEAYDNGLAPLSKIGSGKYIKLAAQIVGAAEWHHTSKFCNATDFYSVRAIKGCAAELRAKKLTSDAIATLRADRAVSRARPQGELAFARGVLIQARKYDRQADEWRRQTAAAATELDRSFYAGKADLYAGLAADWRASARKRIAAYLAAKTEG